MHLIFFTEIRGYLKGKQYADQTAQMCWLICNFAICVCLTYDNIGVQVFANFLTQCMLNITKVPVKKG